MRFLTAIPVYNEERTSGRRPATRCAATARHPRRQRRLDRRHGRTAGPPARICTSSRHPQNRGYGAALISAFAYALATRVRRAGDDGLRRPARAGPHLRCCWKRSTTPTSSPAAAICATSARTRCAPEDRRRINQQITTELNAPLRPAPDRRLLRLQGVSPRGPGAAAHHRNRLGHAAAAVGAGGAGRAAHQGSRRAAALPRSRTGRSAACSTTPPNGWPTIAA